MFETEGGRRFDLPDGLTPEEERAALMALERYFVEDDPKPAPWVLQGRIEATGYGALQVRRFAREPRSWQRGTIARNREAPIRGRNHSRLNRRDKTRITLPYRIGTGTRQIT